MAGPSGRNVTVSLNNKDEQIFNATILLDKNGTQEQKFKIELATDIYTNLPNGGILILRMDELNSILKDQVDFERLIFIQPKDKMKFNITTS